MLTWRVESTDGQSDVLDETVWFQYPRTASGTIDVITVIAPDGEPEPGKTLVRILSIEPPLPEGLAVVISSDIPAAAVRLVLELPRAAVLIGASVPIIELAYQRLQGGQLTRAEDFDGIPREAEEVISYHADTTYLPAYTITIEADEWAPNGGAFVGSERRTYRFGLQKDYSINRDALVAAVNLRRRS